MPKAFVRTLESAPEAERGQYRPNPADQGGGFVLKDVEANEGWELVNTTGLKSALEKERTTAAERDRKLKEYGELTPEAAKTLRENFEKLKASDSDATKRAEELVKQREAEIIKKASSETEKEKARAERYRQGVINKTLRIEANAAITKLEGNPVFLEHLVLGQMRLKENDDGTFAAEVFNPQTGDRRGGRIEGTTVLPMTPEELVAEFKANPLYAAAFKASGSSGGGATGKTGSDAGGGTGGASGENLSPLEKMRLGRAARRK